MKGYNWSTKGLSKNTISIKNQYLWSNKVEVSFSEA